MGQFELMDKPNLIINDSFDIEGEQDILFYKDMNWAKPEYSNDKVDMAGKTLINPKASLPEREKAIDIIDNFRAAHYFPLNTMQVWLRNNAKEIQPNCIVVQRIKRLYSLQIKLHKMRNLRLSEMQDIGGCRAIFSDINNIEIMVKKYCTSSIRHRLAYSNDYIKEPKRSGYRSVHLIYEYCSDRNSIYNNQRIEIQLRSPLQHAWATAVESVDTFTGQRLKVGQGAQNWRRFFILIAAAMALTEKAPAVPDTPTDFHAIRRELEKCTKQINVIRQLLLVGQALQESTQSMQDAKYYLLSLDEKNKQISIFGFTNEKPAFDQYKKVEREQEKKDYLDAVLVSAEEAKSLRRAYPNYFLDIKKFNAYLGHLLIGPK